MWRTVLVAVVSSGIILVAGNLGNLLCDGLFKVDNVELCDDPDQYPIAINLHKKKINRTHDGFNLVTNLPFSITDDVMLRLETFAKCDGGYKASDIVGPSSMCSVARDHIKENFEKALTMAGVDPPDCPLPEGPFELNNFVIDYETMPTRAKCGQSKTHAYLMKDGVDVSCITVYTTFSPRDDDED